MDELELLKKDWKKQEENLPRYQAAEIYPMLHKKSSSIVKWIFIISIIELGISTFLNIYLTDKQFWNEVNSIHLKNVTIGLYIFGYVVTLVFIWFFYKNYRAISTTDNSAQLMKNILKTRRIVKYYILYVLISCGLTMILFFVFSALYPPETIQPNAENINWGYFILIGIVTTVVFLGIIWLIYSLAYGILLRKLKRNYKELKRLEMEQ